VSRADRRVHHAPIVSVDFWLSDIHRIVVGYEYAVSVRGELEKSTEHSQWLAAVGDHAQLQNAEQAGDFP
jgi:hypothetical protein